MSWKVATHRLRARLDEDVESQSLDARTSQAFDIQRSIDPLRADGQWEVLGSGPWATRAF